MQTWLLSDTHMERSTLALVVGGIVVLVGAGIGGAYTMGLVPGDSGGSPPPVNTTDSAPLAHSIENITACGRTCRIMNATVRNDGNSTAENVTVHYKIYTDGDEIWTGSKDIGQMDANSSVPVQSRIEVSSGAGLKIQGNDGYVTIRANVTSEQGNIHAESRKKVA